MLKLIITVTVFMTTLLCQAQVLETRKADHFSRIEVASGIELHYKETQEEASIKVEAPEGILTDIITKVEGETLKIMAKGKVSNVKVYVEANGIESFNGTSKSRIIFENIIHSEDISIALKSGAYFKGYFKADGVTQIETDSDAEFNGRIETTNFFGDFKNHSKINLSGKAQKATIKSATKAYCNAKNFLTQNTEVESDNAIVIITSKNKINVNATENGSITYFGSPKKATVKDKQLIDVKKYRKPLLVAME